MSRYLYNIDISIISEDVFQNASTFIDILFSKMSNFRPIRSRCIYLVEGVGNVGLVERQLLPLVEQREEGRHHHGRQELLQTVHKVGLHSFKSMKKVSDKTTLHKRTCGLVPGLPDFS
jgi:hypothetical protein